MKKPIFLCVLIILASGCSPSKKTDESTSDADTTLLESGVEGNTTSQLKTADSLIDFIGQEEYAEKGQPPFAEYGNLEPNDANFTRTDARQEESRLFEKTDKSVYRINNSLHTKYYQYDDGPDKEYWYQGRTLNEIDVILEKRKGATHNNFIFPDLNGIETDLLQMNNTLKVVELKDGRLLQLYSTDPDSIPLSGAIRIWEPPLWHTLAEFHFDNKLPVGIRVENDESILVEFMSNNQEDNAELSNSLYGRIKIGKRESKDIPKDFITKCEEAIRNSDMAESIVVGGEKIFESGKITVYNFTETLDGALDRQFTIVTGLDNNRTLIYDGLEDTRSVIEKLGVPFSMYTGHFKQVKLSKPGAGLFINDALTYFRNFSEGYHYLFGIIPDEGKSRIDSLTSVMTSAETGTADDCGFSGKIGKLEATEGKKTIDIVISTEESVVKDGKCEVVPTFKHYKLRGDKVVPDE